MFCPKCGAEILEGAEFCQKCGAKLISNDTAPQGAEASGRQESVAAGNTQVPPLEAVKPGKLQRFAKYGKVITVVALALVFLGSFVRIPISPIILGFVAVLGAILSASDIKKPLKASSIIKLIWPCAILVVMIVLLVLLPRQGSGSDKYVQMVKEGTLEAYPSKTVGEAFDGYLKNPKWESGVSEDGTRCVNVTGKILYYEKETDILVQFIVENDKVGSFSYNACELNGIPQDNFFVSELLEAIYNGDKSTSTKDSSDYVPGENGIMIGETRSTSDIYGGEMEVTLDSIEFTDGPLLTGYDSLTPDDGFTYLVATLTVKNTGTIQTGLNTIESTVIYDGKYEYEREFETIGEDITDLAPLSNAKTTAIIFMVPKAVAESENALVINIATGYVGNDISYVIRSGNNDEFDAGVQTPSTEYVGTWQDTYSQRCYMEISSSDGIQYYIDINWGSSAQENTHWSLWGMYDEVMGGIYYNGSKVEEYYPEGGEMQETVVYSDGAGLIWMGDDGMLYWDDHVEEQGMDCSFEKSIY